VSFVEKIQIPHADKKAVGNMKWKRACVSDLRYEYLYRLFAAICL